jgi:diguanylate cyclase (GGDEF)-like protein
LTIVLTSVVLAVTMGVIAYYRRRLDSMTVWALAVALHASAFLLFLLRGQISDLVSIVVANVLMATSFAVFAEGLFQFQGRRPRRWLIWLPVPVTVIAMLVWIGDIQARVIAAGAITWFQSLLLLMILLQRRRATPGVGQYILAAALVMTLVTLGLRVIGTALGVNSIVSLTSSNPLQTLTFLASFNGLILFVMGLIVMAKERAEEQLRLMALHDALTGLANRALFDEHLETALALARRDQTQFGLMFVDLDKFKEVNDTLGHRIGDLLLQEVARRLCQAVRASDTPGRIGGDEFIILLRHLQRHEEALQVAEKIRAMLDEPFTIEGHSVSISGSIGIAIYPDHGTDAIQLSRSADAAMYRTKSSGRNGMTLASGP